MPRYDNQVTIPLSDAESDRLMPVPGTWKNRMVALAFRFCPATEKRTGEAFNPTWSDMDYENEVIRFEIKSMSKGRYRYLPMNDLMKSILAEDRTERQTRSSLVFHSTNGSRILPMIRSEEGWQRRRVCFQAVAGYPRIENVLERLHPFC